MGRLIAVIQQKGGVGKSTTVVELACAWGVHSVTATAEDPLAPGAEPVRPPARVLVIDMDAQAGATRKFGIDPEGIAREQSIIAVLEDDDHPIDSSRWRGIYEGFGIDLVPAQFDMEATEAELARRNTVHVLRDKLAAVLDDYDYVLVDSRPSLGMLTLNALFAANEVIIPVSLIDPECMNGTRAVIDVLAQVSEDDHDVTLLGALATFHDARKQGMADKIRSYVSGNLGVPFLEAVIPDRSHFANAGLDGLPVNVWRPRVDAASRYRRLAAEIAARGNAHA